MNGRNQGRRLHEEHEHVPYHDTEKTHEHKIAGSFAHEIRNALAGAAMLLGAVISDEMTLCQQNSEHLGKIFDLIDHYIPAECRDDVLAYFRAIDHNEEMVDEVIRMLTQTLQSALEVATLTLEYSRLGWITPGMEDVNLQDVINTILTQHRQRLTRQKITPRIGGQITHARKGTVSHFHSMINNLVVNACDAFEEVSDDRARILELTLEETEQTQIVTVRDNATGVPVENRQKIFEPFFSTKPTTGTGLG